MNAHNGFNAPDYQARLQADALEHFKISIEDAGDLYPEEQQQFLEQHWDAEMDRLGIQ